MNPESMTGYPGDWSRNYRKRPGHTWARLARLMYPRAHDQSEALRALFADVWLVERSMHAARVKRDGRAPSAQRIAFLCEQAWPILTARVLLLYGSVAPDAWRSPGQWGAGSWHHANIALSSGFLGVDLTHSSVSVELMPSRRARWSSAARFSTPSRTVIWCYHVSGSALVREDRAAVQRWFATAVQPTGGCVDTG